MQSCLSHVRTLCDPMNYSLPGSSFLVDSPGKNARVSCHFLLQGNLPDLGIKLGSLMSPARTDRFFATWEAPNMSWLLILENTTASLSSKAALRSGGLGDNPYPTNY